MKTWRMSLNLFLISAALHLTKRWKFRTKKSSRRNEKMTLMNCLMTSLSSLRLKANAASHCFSVISALDTTVRHESSMNSRRGGWSENKKVPNRERFMSSLKNKRQKILFRVLKENFFVCFLKRGKPCISVHFTIK